MEPTWQPTLERLAAAQRLHLVTHEQPDPDGLGAMLALGEHLRRAGKVVRMFAPQPVPEPYRVVRGWELIEVCSPGATPKGDAPELAVLVDANQHQRVGGWTKALPALCVDHHLPSTDSPAGIIEPGRSSASELVYEVVLALGGEVTPDMAHNLYTGLLFDTRSFRFIQGHPRALRIASELIPLGVDTEEVFEALFSSLPRGFLTLTGQLLSDLRWELDGHLVWGVVTMRQGRELGIDKALLQEVLPFMLMVGSVRVALLYKELENGKYKCSLRSKDAIDVRRVAEMHGGGGHRNASGVTLELAPEEHVRLVLPLLAPEIGA
jgi:phosphoesterase RecJ-like protein